MESATQETVALPAHHPAPKLLQFDPGIGLWTLLCFVLLLALLKRFAWKPILDSIDARDKKLQQALDHADQLSEEARLQTERQAALLAQAHNQAAVILSEAHDQAKALKENILVSAAEEKQRLLRSAGEDIARQAAQIQNELRLFSAQLAVNTAEKILIDQLDKTKAEALADRMVQDFKP